MKADEKNKIKCTICGERRAKSHYARRMIVGKVQKVCKKCRSICAVCQGPPTEQDVLYNDGSLTWDVKRGYLCSDCFVDREPPKTIDDFMEEKSCYGNPSNMMIEEQRASMTNGRRLPKVTSD